jgi:hypothetical protein
MHCYAESGIDFQGREDLAEARDAFGQHQIEGTTLFDRPSHATLGGKTALWAISGAPSPIVEEMNDVEPTMAIVMYGTNDIGWFGNDFAKTFRWYSEAYLELVDTLLERGVIPVLSAIPHRTNKPELQRWTPTLNNLVRGIAEHHQIPFVDYYLATTPLPDFGLFRDGVHPNTMCDGNIRCGCRFDPEGLEHGYNLRNWIVLEALDRTRRALIAPESVTGESPLPTLQGLGTSDDPVVVDRIPFTDFRNTHDSTSDMLDVYTGCDAIQDESGPEVIYRLELEEERRLRFMVIDRSGVDVDIHILGESGAVETCIERNDVVVDRTLGPGTYTIVADSFVSESSGDLGGEYLLSISACEDGDPTCNAL